MNNLIGAQSIGDGLYTVECSSVSNLPDISFYFGGKAYPLNASDYILEDQGTCISPFTALDHIDASLGSLWIIGNYSRLLVPLSRNALNSLHQLTSSR